MRLAGPAALRPRRLTLALCLLGALLLHLLLHLLGALLLHLLLHLLGALLLHLLGALLLHLLGALLLLLHLLGALPLHLLGALLLQLLALLLQLLLGDRGPRLSGRNWRGVNLARLALSWLDLLARHGLPGKRMRSLLPRLELPRRDVPRTARREARLSRPSLARERGDLTR